MRKLRCKASSRQQFYSIGQNNQTRIALHQRRQGSSQHFIKLRLRHSVLRQYGSKLRRYRCISHLLHIHRLRHLQKLTAAQLVYLLALLHLNMQIGKGLQQSAMYIFFIAGTIGDKAQLAMLLRKADRIFISRLPVFHMQNKRIICQKLPLRLTHPAVLLSVPAPAAASQPARALRGSPPCAAP